VTEPARARTFPVTVSLIALCAGMAFLTLPGDPDALLARLYRFGAKENGAIAAGQYWRLLTAAFLHGGVVHLLVNSYSLFVLGSLTEPVLGHVRFLATFLFSALTGSLTSWAFNGAIGVGASGAIFGLLGTALYLSWRGTTAHIPPTALRSLALWTVYNLVFGFITPTIDNAAHLGGLAGGILCAVLLHGRLVPLGVTAAGLGILGWGGYAISHAPDTSGQVSAYLEGEAARTRGELVVAESAYVHAPEFAPALATQAFLRLSSGHNAASLALADSALKLLDDPSPRAGALRLDARAIGIDVPSLRGRIQLIRAWALFRLGRRDEGEGAATKAAENASRTDRLRAALLLGEVRLQEGRPQEALLQLRPVTSAADTLLRAQAHHDVALALDALGRRQEAILEAEAAARLDPSDSGYAQLLSELRGRDSVGSIPAPRPVPLRP
jgi:membrane associated rhomboid family serine protease